MTTNSPNPVDGDVQALIERAESAEAKLLEIENQKLDAEVKLYRQESIIPEGLNRCTAELVMDFSKALAEKLHRSEQKYGWSDGWKDADWQEKCLADFNHHIDKGDPRDVAAYCAFMWFHGWKTQHTTPPAQILRPVEKPTTKCIGWVKESIQEHDEKWISAIREAGYEVKS